MGSVFSGGGTTNNTTNSTSPWGPQAGPLQDLFGRTTQTATQQLQGGYPFNAGQLYAGTNAQQQQGASSLYGTGAAGNSAGNFLTGFGTGAVNYALPQSNQTGMNIAQGQFNGGQNGAGYSAAGNVPTSLGQTNAGINGAMQIAGQNTPQSLAAGAGALMNNGVINGQIDALGTDIRRNLTEQQLPGLNAGASATGNMDSSRAGVAQGILERGANENLVNGAAQIRSNAYNQGLSLAQQQQQGNASTMLGAANTANSATGEGIYGQSSSNSNTMAGNQLQLSGAGLLTQNAGLGGSLAAQGNALGAGGAQQMLAGGGVAQTNQQNQDNANVQAWTNQQQYPWSVLNNASGILQRNNWGTTQNQTQHQTQQDNPFGDVLGAGALAGSLFKGAGGAGALSSLFG